MRLLGELSLVALAFVLLARFFWVFELFSHFRVQLLVAQLLLLTAFLVMRRPLWAVTLGIACVINGAPIRGYLLPLGGSTATAVVDPLTGAELPAEIRVLSANVRGSNIDASGLIDVVRAVEPDVFAVLELTDEFAEALGELEVAYPWRMLIPESGNFGIGVYSSLPDTEFVRFELDGYAAIDAQVGGGAWRFVAAHLVPPMSAALARQRNVQLVQLSEYVQEIDQPVVLAGDFNLTPFSPIFTEFAAESELSSALRGFGPGMTWPSFFPLLGIPIDQVFVSEEFAVADYFRAGDIGSDHFPIIVDMNRRRLRLDSR